MAVAMTTVDAVANMITEIFEFVNTKEGKKYSEETLDLKEKIRKEKAKKQRLITEGDDKGKVDPDSISDDRQIEEWQARMNDIAGLAIAELRAYAGKK